MTVRSSADSYRKAAQPMPESPVAARKRHSYRRNRPQPASAPSSPPVIRGVPTPTASEAAPPRQRNQAVPPSAAPAVTSSSESARSHQREEFFEASNRRRLAAPLPVSGSASEPRRCSARTLPCALRSAATLPPNPDRERCSGAEALRHLVGVERFGADPAGAPVAS
jgi:hypothetical protein